jgi:hypothetical protein
MTDRISWFEEMTAEADALREDNPVESIELFKIWGLQYAAKCQFRQDQAIAHIIPTSEEYARASVPSDPFVCPGCGEVLANLPAIRP